MTTTKQQWPKDSSNGQYYHATVQRIQNLFAPVVIYTLNEKDEFVPYATLSAEILNDLVINNHLLREQIDLAAPMIAWWGRLVAHTRRMLEVAERQHRNWRSKHHLSLLEKAEASGKKKPTESEIEASYRSQEAYMVQQGWIETLTESHLFAESVYQAFRARKDLLTVDVYRSRDGGLHRMSP